MVQDPSGSQKQSQKQRKPLIMLDYQRFFFWELYALVPNHVFANKVV